MVSILETVSYVIPMFGNKRSVPYGKLRVSDGAKERIVPIKEDGIRQYFTLNYKRHYVQRKGPLYSSYWVLEN